MISVLIIIIDILLLAACAGGLFAVYLWGIRDGVDIIAQQELAEMEAGIIKVPSEWAEYVKWRRETVYKRDSEKVYQLWRKAQGLPDGTIARELFNDPDYRQSLEEQKKHGG